MWFCSILAVLWRINSRKRRLAVETQLRDDGDLNIRKKVISGDDILNIT